MIPAPPRDAVDRAVLAALAEDLADTGDITSTAVVDADLLAEGRLVAREDLVLAGLPVADAVFAALDRSVEFHPLAADGDRVRGGTVVARLRGRARTLLAGERTALNFLMRLSGIATAARAAVDEILGTGATILDTRKTTPGLRTLEKYAVAAGGARNHRHGLYDAILIKDTHVAVTGSTSLAVERARAAGYPPAAITVEIASLDEIEPAIAAGAGRLLLDNLSVEAVEEAVRRAAGRAVLEVSGGLRRGGLRAYAVPGVTYLSVGEITHSARAMDLALDLERIP